jgi:hypothetical protein
VISGAASHRGFAGAEAGIRPGKYWQQVRARTWHGRRERLEHRGTDSWLPLEWLQQDDWEKA